MKDIDTMDRWSGPLDPANDPPCEECGARAYADHACDYCGACATWCLCESDEDDQ